MVDNLVLYIKGNSLIPSGNIGKTAVASDARHVNHTPIYHLRDQFYHAFITNRKINIMEEIMD